MIMAGNGARTSLLSVIFAWSAFYTEKLTENPIWSNVISIIGGVATIVAIISGCMAIRYYYYSTKNAKKDKDAKKPM